MLFKDTKKLLEFAEFSNSINFASVAATLQSVEEQHIITLLGQPQYNVLNSALLAAVDESLLTAPLAALLYKCRRVAGPLLCYTYAFKAELKLSDAGLRREETATSKTAFQYQGTNYREANLREGEAATEMLLKFLNNNIADYPLWAASTGYLKFEKLFIKDSKTFNENFPSQTPYRNFTAMRFKMYDVEQLEVRAKITPALFDFLKVKDLAGTAFTSAESSLMVRLQKAIAYLTVAYALPFLRVRIDANGLTVMNQRSGSSNDADNSRMEAGTDPVSHIIRNSASAGAVWLQNALDFVKLNPSEFPSYLVIAPLVVPTCNDTTCGSFGLC